MRFLMWILAAACLYFFENNVGTRIVLISSLVVPLVSLACLYRNHARIHAFLSVPERADCGVSTYCECIVHGLSGSPASGFVHACNRLTGEVFDLEVPIDRHGQGRFALLSPACGCVMLELRHLDVQDMFGLKKRVLRMDATESVCVFPEPRTLQPVRDSGQGEPEEDMKVRRMGEPVDCDVRPYIPGDPVRRIHWKLTEKADEVLIRESGGELREEPVLLLETMLQSAPETDALNRTVQGLFAVSLGMVEQGIEHRVCWHDPDIGLRERRIAGREDSLDMQHELLQTAAMGPEDGIAALLDMETPDVRFCELLIFTPHPETNTGSLTDRGKVTLVLPSSLPVCGVEEGVRVMVLPRDGTGFGESEERWNPD